MITSDQYFVTGRYSVLINRNSGQAALVGRNVHCAGGVALGPDLESTQVGVSVQVSWCSCEAVRSRT